MILQLLHEMINLKIDLQESLSITRFDLAVCDINSTVECHVFNELLMITVSGAETQFISLYIG